MDESRPCFGREVSDEKAGAAMEIGDDGVDLATGEVEPQARPPAASLAAARTAWSPALDLDVRVCVRSVRVGKKSTDLGREFS